MYYRVGRRVMPYQSHRLRHHHQHHHHHRKMSVQDSMHRTGLLILQLTGPGWNGEPGPGVGWGQG